MALGQTELQQHCNELLRQRLSIQASMLTNLKQLKHQDERLLDALSLLQRYPVSYDADLWIQLALTPVGETWLSLTDQTSEEATQDKTPYELWLYSGELACALSESPVDELIEPLWRSASSQHQRLALDLAGRYGYRLSVNQLDTGSHRIYPHWLLYLGKSVQLDQRSCLKSVFQDITTDQRARISAALALLLLGEPVDLSAVIEQLITLDGLSDEAVAIVISGMAEGEATSFINRLAGNELHASHAVRAAAYSGYSKFIPFLADVLESEQHQTTALRGLSLLMGDALLQVVPLSFLVESESDADNELATSQAVTAIQDWYQAQRGVQRLPGRVLAGRALNTTSLELVARSGTVAQRQQAMRYLAVTVAERGLTDAAALWGGQ